MMECLYRATEQDAQPGETHYRCANCRHERTSKYPPQMLHRLCRASPQRTGCGPKPSGIVARLGRYAIAVDRWIKGGSPVRTEAAVLQILETYCNPPGQPCEHFDPKGKCRLCGCNINRRKNPLRNMVSMGTVRCSANKWLSMFDEAVLQCLAHGISVGSEIHPAVCKSLDVTMTLPAFYELMADAAAAGVVSSGIDDRFAGVPQRCYRPGISCPLDPPKTPTEI